MAYGSRLSVNNTLTVIVATAVLHNIARQMNEIEPPLNDPHMFNLHMQDGEIPQIPNINNENQIQNSRALLINEYFARL